MYMEWIDWVDWIDWIVKMYNMVINDIYIYILYIAGRDGPLYGDSKSRGRRTKEA